MDVNQYNVVYNYSTSFSRIFLFDKFSNSIQLNICRSFVYSSNFAIAEKFLHWIIFGESDPTHPLNTLGGGESCYFCMKWIIHIKVNKMLKGGMYRFQPEEKYLAIAASFTKGIPASFSRAALYTSRRAHSICVATWAIWCCIAWINIVQHQHLWCEFETFIKNYICNITQRYISISIGETNKKVLISWRV